MRLLKKFPLIAIFAVAGFSQAALAGPGGSKLTPPLPGPSLACEFYLGGESEATGAKVWLLKLVSAVSQAQAAEIPDHIKPAALAALGLPAERAADLTMKIDSSKSSEGIYWLRILARGEEVRAFPFHLPPLYVWKELDARPEHATLESVLFWEDQEKISAGTILGEFPGGRIFMSLKRDAQRDVTVSLGIDVPDDEHEAYTQIFLPKLVSSPQKEIFGRITVIKAHFHVPRRSGGPGRIT